MAPLSGCFGLEPLVLISARVEIQYKWVGGKERVSLKWSRVRRRSEGRGWQMQAEKRMKGIGGRRNERKRKGQLRRKQREQDVRGWWHADGCLWGEKKERGLWHKGKTVGLVHDLINIITLSTAVLWTDSSHSRNSDLSEQLKAQVY